MIIPQAVALTSETVKSGMCRCTLEKLSNSDICNFCKQGDVLL